MFSYQLFRLIREIYGIFVISKIVPRVFDNRCDSLAKTSDFSWKLSKRVLNDPV